MKKVARADRDADALVVVGGRGGMGRLLARFFRGRGFRVSVKDPAGVPRGFAAATDADLATASVVVNAASLVFAADAMDDLVARRPRGLVFDVASVKASLLPGIERARAAGLAVASVHPMFGPTVRSLAGRDLIVCDAGDTPATRRVLKLFAGAGLAIRRMPLAEHDAWVARTMGLAHVVALAVAASFRATGVSVTDLDGRSSTSFRRLVELLTPILDQPASLTWAIQRQNPESKDPLERFEREVSDLRARLANDPAAFEAWLKALRSDLFRPPAS